MGQGKRRPEISPSLSQKLTKEESETKRPEQAREPGKETLDNFNDTSEQDLETKEQGVQARVDRDDQCTLRSARSADVTHNKGQLFQIISETLDSGDDILDDLRQDGSDLVQVVGGTLSLGDLKSFGDSSEASLLDVDADSIAAERTIGNVDRVENVVEVDLRIVGGERLGGVALVDRGDGGFLLSVELYGRLTMLDWRVVTMYKMGPRLESWFALAGATGEARAPTEVRANKASRVKSILCGESIG